MWTADRFFDPAVDRVLLSSIPSLTFYDGEVTRARRSAPVAQLACDDSGRRLCRRYAPDVVQCVNVAPDESGRPPNWRCEANLPPAVRLGRVQVSCEGWDRPGDAYVLEGSCGLIYRLLPASGGTRPPASPPHRGD